MPTQPPTSTIHPDVPPFPSPSTFSLLPDIYILIARLRLLHPPPHPSQPTNAINANGNTNGAAPTTYPSQPQPQPSNNQIPASILNNLPLLDPKDLPGQMYPFKQKLARARESVVGLPDVKRTVEEQEVEIRRLEGMVRALRRRLGELGGIARERERGDVVMGDGMS
jgi:hypothetical protein